MHILHVQSKQDVSKIEQYIKEGKHLFILIYMEGCGPCNATRPEWNKLSASDVNDDKVVVIDVNKNDVDGVSYLGQIDGYPSMKYINNNIIESYEQSDISTKDRSKKSFVEWIKSKTGGTKSKSKSSAKRLYERIKYGGRRKYSRKYKRTSRKKKRYVPK